MSKKRYLNILIFCSILSQGVIGTFLEDNHDNSLDLHVRKKRANNHMVTEQKEWSITDIPYIVKVLEYGLRVCIGIIVSPELILTVGMCANGHIDAYEVESGQPFVTPVKTHRVINKYMEGHLVLLVIRPFISINYPSLNRNIILHDPPVPPHALSTIAGWGPTIGRQESLHFRRSENVPLVSLEICSIYYQLHNIELTNDNMCVLESAGNRGLTSLDTGSALVINDELVGVLIYAGRNIRYDGPDVFLRVNDNNTYNMWIKSYIGPYLYNHVNRQHPHNLNPQNQHPHNQHLYDQYQHPHTSRNPSSFSPSNQH